MAKVEEYAQGQLASSLGYASQVRQDTSTVDLISGLNKNVNELLDAEMAYAISEQKKQKANEDLLNGINQMLTAYDEVGRVEASLHDYINQTKQDYTANPHDAIEAVHNGGMDIIKSAIDNVSDPKVKEKMAGILTNHFSGKENEIRNWALGMETANAQSKVQSVMDNYSHIAANTDDPNQVISMIKGLDVVDENTGMSMAQATYLSYGAKTPKYLAQQREDIAESYLMGMIDRGKCSTVKSLLESGQLDDIVSPELKHKYLKATGVIERTQQRQYEMGNMVEIFNIKANAVVKASKDEYTFADAERDNKRIMELGGKPTVSLYNQASSNLKTLTKKEFNEKKAAALEDINSTFRTVLSNANGKLDPHATMKDILSYQNKVEKAKPYLTANEYNTYMNKVSQPLVKRISKMGTNIIGMPQGELAKHTPQTISYRAFYNFAHKNYAGTNNRNNAIKNMLSDFTRYQDDFSAKFGREPTQKELNNLANRAIFEQRKRTNPNLNNIPKEGKVFRDKNGKRVRIYPSGKMENLN